ncbi:C40 family peptidase [Actinomadura luteofluorescens]|uniref:C40 family peptidase n=1 Tax=Actinomadura luteofluorescens TaxID=46163 RepID=UPI0036405CD9
MGRRQEDPRGRQDQGRRGDEAPRQADHHPRERPPHRPQRHREGLRPPRQDGPQGPHQTRLPVRLGRRRPSSFDCSGLVVWAYAQVGKPGLPHYTGDLFAMGSKVSRGALRSGDLVYFGGNLHHMGIYLGDGKYLHAPQTGDVVKISKLSDRSDFAARTVFLSFFSSFGPSGPPSSIKAGDRWHRSVSPGGSLLCLWQCSPPSGLGGPPSSSTAGDRWHRSDSPGGSLRDQVLASSNLPSDAIATVGLLRGCCVG